MRFSVIFISFMFLLSGVLTGQDRQVRGLITDATDGTPLIGATVMVAETTTGTVTDFNGEFDIRVPEGGSLVVSYLGYDNYTVAVDGRTTIDIEMSSTAAMLEELVVVGYGTKQRKDITGAVTSVEAKDLEKKPITRLENILQGQAAGVQVNQFSGAPGNSISVRIRGATSLSAGNEPLYVIDGVPVLNTEGINPADVESLEVLKDASASAIYGARAANGVVLITTKKGVPGKPKISLSTSVGFSQITKTLDLLDAAGYVDLVNESYVNAGQAPVLDGADFTEDTDWQDEVYRNATTTNHQLSLSGGNGKTRYFVSGSQQRQEGVVRESDFQRTGLRVNFSTELKPGFELGTTMNLSRVSFNSVPDNNRVNQGGVILGALSSPPIIGILNEDGTYTTNPLQAWENPVANIIAPQDQSATNRIVGNLYAAFDVLPGLRFKTSFGIEAYANKNDYFLDPFSTQFGRSLQGIGIASTNQEMIWLTENTLTYDYSAGAHAFTFLGGITAQESAYESTYARAEGFPNGAVTTLNAGSRKIDASTGASQWALFSYLGRVSYKFQEKYLADVSFRADGSSRFGAGNRFAYFPSVSLGWRVSEEGFLKGNDAINDLKIRVSAGMTGNQNIGDFASYGLFATGANYNFNGQIFPGTRPSTISNENLRWETTSQVNIGFDLALFDFRANLTMDYYLKNTSDLLVNVDLPRSTGFGSGIQNLGEVRNQGLEFSLKTYNVRGKKVDWSTNFNASTNSNEVINIGGPDKVIFAGGIPERGDAVIVREGLPLGSFFGWVSEGVSPVTGDIVFSDLNDDGIIDDEDRTVIGDANPDVLLGLNNSITIGGLSLDVLFQATIGNDVLNATRIETEGMFTVNNALATTATRWQNEGDITRIPRAVFGDPNQNSRISSRFIEDGSHLRLRNVTLSYNLPTELLSRFKVQTMSVYFSGQNLWILSDYSGYDPEVNRDGGSAISQGIDYGTYPQSKIFTGGLKLEF
ncbi:SusC/RagA family TonB-linked outer membrane protein [Neolewinella antarctica]|uniref:TonB-linked SusC/RagA family outer membrane protein n=1 Tax=Neolewinella antarctica TaxID=442734 RepID=A0ABX0X8P1_9BACT|nr:TonB-dependent receptor [Neolewinella antarctica]NJC25629.1 TonB-linked SusC/RagA family outer membrane protein [Neolewinella antarctica]